MWRQVKDRPFSPDIGGVGDFPVTYLSWCAFSECLQPRPKNWFQLQILFVAVFFPVKINLFIKGDLKAFVRPIYNFYVLILKSGWLVKLIELLLANFARYCQPTREAQSVMSSGKRREDSATHTAAGRRAFGIVFRHEMWHAQVDAFL